MGLIRAIVFSATLAVALAPLAALADTTPEHAQAELANGNAQWDLAQQQVSDLQRQANDSAANERMIALLRSEALRQRSLNMIANSTAMEEIAAALANAARANGDFNAQNELGIAQIKAAALVANVDANIANATMLAQLKGRFDELANARAQGAIAHQAADFITSVLAERNMSNAKQIGQEQADAIHTPALVNEQNGLAMAATDLLATDVVLSAGQVNAGSAIVSTQTKAAAILDHAAASLKNAQAMAANAH